MSKFNHKNKKNEDKKIIPTIDKKHQEMMLKFKQNEKKLEMFKKQRSKLKNKMLNESDSSVKATLKDRLLQINNSIKLIKNGKKNIY